MLTCNSPRRVMRAAYALACDALPDHCSKFSRHDFTLPQLFACLVVKEQMRRSYRGAEALLRDCDHWLGDVGLTRAPDDNTLWQASTYLLGRCRVATNAKLARTTNLVKSRRATQWSCGQSIGKSSRHAGCCSTARQSGGMVIWSLGGSGL